MSMPYIAIYHVLYCFETSKCALSRGPVKLPVYNLNSNKEQGKLFQPVWKTLLPIYAMSAFRNSGTQKALDTVVFHRKSLQPSVGAAGSRNERHAKLPI